VPATTVASGRPGFASVEAQDQEARVARVEHPEAVLARLDVEHRPRLAVDHHEVGEDRRDDAAIGGRRVQVEAAVGLEPAVLQQQLDLVVAARQHAPGDEAELRVVAQQVHAGQAGEHVQARDAERVVVVPERAAALVVDVVVRGLGPHLALLGEALREPAIRLAVALGLDVRAVQVRDRRDLAGPEASGTMSVVSTGSRWLSASVPVPTGRPFCHCILTGRPCRATIVAPGQLGGRPSCW
jgi:hypothetical protein